ncbi:MAG: rod shape-determining protein MreC [Victivallaceae bacterium]|nr:rod shape-determining protein MreC [Victivallaceae bacterium]
MAGLKNRNFDRWNYGLIAAALLVVILVAGFQTVRLTWFRITNDFFYPYLKFPAGARYFAADESLRLYSKPELAAKIDRLQTDNRIFAAQVARLGELAIENERLRRLLKFPLHPNCDYVAAEIILRDPLRWKEGFTVSRGTEDGIIAGTPVLCFNPEYPRQAILAGVVRDAARHSAQVTSVLNPCFRISAYLAETRTHGIINGDSRQSRRPDEINISFLSARKHFHPGEACLTSGFEHLIPAGFLIGRLKSLDSKNQIFSNELYLSAKIIPAAPLDNLHFVVLAIPRAKRNL